MPQLFYLSGFVIDIRCSRIYVMTGHPKALANTTKHLAFARCGELNLYGMVEEQVARIELELFAGAV